MAYEKQVGSDNPGCIIILVDQSMGDIYGDGTEEKKDVVARAVNSVIDKLVTSCTDSEEIKDRCHVNVIGYSDEVNRVIEGMISEIGESPKRFETVKKKESDGAGGLVEIEVQMPIWLEPKAVNGTPMDEAFQQAYDIAQEWCTEYPNSFPPIVINITDGAPDDPEATHDAAKRVMGLETTDGNVLVFNIHISSWDGARSVILPHSTNQLEGDPYANFLFNISSVLPESLVDGFDLRYYARYFNVSTEFDLRYYARYFGYNVSEVDLIRLLNFASIGLCGHSIKAWLHILRM